MLSLMQPWDSLFSPFPPVHS